MNLDGTPLAFSILNVEVAVLLLCVLLTADALLVNVVADVDDTILPLLSALLFGNTRKYCTCLPGSCIVCSLRAALELLVVVPVIVLLPEADAVEFVLPPSVSGFGDNLINCWLETSICLPLADCTIILWPDVSEPLLVLVGFVAPLLLVLAALVCKRYVVVLAAVVVAVVALLIDDALVVAATAAVAVGVALMTT